MPSIIDVIAKTDRYTKSINYYIVVDVMPRRVYERNGNFLYSNDDGFFDFMKIEPGTTDAFAGRKFSIDLADGSQYHCKGDVWACGGDVGEPLVQAGVSTLEELKKCYVFSATMVSEAKLNAWLAMNKPSVRYYKYDPRQTIEYILNIANKYAPEKSICAQRARKLRRKGKTIFRTEGGKRSWQPWFERRKAEILADIALDN